MRDRVKEPRVGDVWVAKDGYPRTIYDPEYADEGMPDTVEKQVAMLITLGYIPAIVLPLDIALELQQMVAGMKVAADIDGNKPRLATMTRLLTALANATGERVEVKI